MLGTHFPYHPIVAVLFALAVALVGHLLRTSATGRSLAARWRVFRYLSEHRLPAFALGVQVPTNIGQHVLQFISVAPVSQAGNGTVNGLSFDRQNPIAGSGSSNPIGGGGTQANLAMSLAAFLQVGVITGGPTTIAVDVKVQHSNDSAGADPWTDYTNAESHAAVVASTANMTANGSTISTSASTLTSTSATSQSVELDVNLSGAKRFLRLVVTVGSTGSAPTVLIGASAVLGGFGYEPA